jgi:hypothetical protein
MADVISLRPVPQMASDETIDGLWKLLQESTVPQLVPELFFSTKKRHELGRIHCRKCMCNFLPDTACPNCGSQELEPFAGTKPIRRSAFDREAMLTDIDPEWRERFHGDVGLAIEYYRKLL